MFFKMSVIFAENEKKLSEITLGFSTKVNSLRDEVQAWSQTFATRVETIVTTGDFKVDSKPPVHA